jgi:hypothetical protein
MRTATPPEARWMCLTYGVTQTVIEGIVEVVKLPRWRSQSALNCWWWVGLYSAAIALWGKNTVNSAVYGNAVFGPEPSACDERSRLLNGCGRR